MTLPGYHNSKLKMLVAWLRNWLRPEPCPFCGHPFQWRKHCCEQSREDHEREMQIW